MTHSQLQHINMSARDRTYVFSSGYEAFDFCTILVFKNRPQTRLAVLKWVMELCFSQESQSQEFSLSLTKLKSGSHSLAS